MITVVGALFAVAGIALFLARPDRVPWLLAVSVGFTATAAVVAAGQTVAAFWPLAILLVVVAARRGGLTRVLNTSLTDKPGLRPLLAFGGWSVLLTAVAPWIFSGLPVLNPRDGIDDGVRDPAALAPQISNVAQAGYLMIAIATVLALAALAPSVDLLARLPAAAFGAATAASSLRAVLPENVAQYLFDNSPSIAYTAGEFEGIERMRGVFSEPSALGTFSVAAAVYFAMTATRSRGAERLVATVMAVWACANAVLSFSGGALVSGLVVVALVVVRAVVVYVRGRSSISAPGLVAIALAVPALVVWGPALRSFVGLMLGDKVDSSSYENRSAADAFSYDLVERTLGLGVGLGSNRPSSYLASMLSTTGVIGTVLLLIALCAIVASALRIRGLQPTAWALVALVISKVVSGPNVVEASMWFLVAVCAAGVWREPSADDRLDVDPARALVAVRTAS